MKEYKISYKVYHNERLGMVKYNGKETHPLYVQVLFDRKPIYFKSYYFDLLSKINYNSYGDAPIPSLEGIIEKENALLDFIIEQNKDDFSLETMKEQYSYYAVDILSIMENDFKYFLYVYFKDVGLPSIAQTIFDGTGKVLATGLLEDLKSALTSNIYSKLIENAVYNAPPYLPLYQFTQQLSGDKSIYSPLPSYLWQNAEVQNQFEKFLTSLFPEYNVDTIRDQVEKYLDV